MGEYIEIYLNFASKNIYGFIPILALIYGIAFMLKKAIKKFPDPSYFVMFGFLVCLSILPSYPRYSFEKKIFSQHEIASEWKLIKSTRWGDIIEPRTWFNAPYGFFHYVSPDLMTKYNFKGGSNVFKSNIYRYEEDTIFNIVSVQCSDKLIWIAAPDNDGIYRETNRNTDMDKYEFKIFCKRDYTKEYKILRCKALKLLELESETISRELLANANTECLTQQKKL